MEEAARDLGATTREVLRYITLPHLVPALAAAAILAFSYSFNNFVISFFMGGFELTFPIWVFSTLRHAQNVPIVNAIRRWSRSRRCCRVRRLAAGRAPLQAMAAVDADPMEACSRGRCAAVAVATAHRGRAARGREAGCGAADLLARPAVIWLALFLGPDGAAAVHSFQQPRSRGPAA